MTEFPSKDFNIVLAEAKQKTNSIKSTDLKKLLKVAGKRPTDAQLAELADLVRNSPDCHRLAFQLIAEFDLSRGASPSSSKLASMLGSNFEQLFGNPPPPVNTSPSEASRWLQSELSQATSPKDDGAKIRAILLWVLRQYRNPDLFIACCAQLAQSGRGVANSIGRSSGFAFHKIAKKIAVIGCGKQPRLSKLRDHLTPLIAMQNYLQEKISTADRAIAKLDYTEQCLNRANEKLIDLDIRISELQAGQNELEKIVAEAQERAKEWEQKHADAIAHSESESDQARLATMSQLRAKISPKLQDVLLYINRPTPAVDQVKRLAGEIEHILGV